ncbi:hypothetical protein S4A8_03173 [Salinisphaera sp. S4-8]|uniref:hypothetical protein n=1 Tax=Salinisphaera sp. S4-8 TaxID=633357 RepID=UPI003340B9C2
MPDQDQSRALRIDEPVTRHTNSRQIDALDEIRRTTIREETLSRFAYEYPDAFWHWLDNHSEVVESSPDLDAFELLPASSYAGNTHYGLCRARAMRDLACDPDWPRPPANECLFCTRSVVDTGGYRWVRTAHVRVALVPDELLHAVVPVTVASRTQPLFDEGGSLSVILWKRNERVTTKVLDQAVRTFRECRLPWFCQRCGSIESRAKPSAASASGWLVVDDGFIRTLAETRVNSY